jgi:hypothetical protein
MKKIVTLFCILVVLVASNVLSFQAGRNYVEATPTPTAFVSPIPAPAIVSTVQEAAFVSPSFQAGTGECGLLNNQGLLHRNGEVHPDYCNYFEEVASVVIVKHNKPESTPVPTFVPTQNPTQIPTIQPTQNPTEVPTTQPTPKPTDEPKDKECHKDRDNNNSQGNHDCSDHNPDPNSGQDNHKDDNHKDDKHN